jgi:dolichol-phosphate mannosyltransferase
VSGPADSLSPTESADGVLIGVCTLNEAENIGPLIRQLKQSIPSADILIVDDDSSDRTGAIVSEMANQDSSIILNVRKNERGLGTAIRHAMSYAIDHDYTYFLNLDGDFSHNPAELGDLLSRAAQDTSLDVVIGSRYAPGGSIVGWPTRRRIMSRIVNGFATLCLRLPVKDCSGSMRCYRVSALNECGMHNLKSSGYAVLEEILLQLHLHGASFAEVPVTFTDRRYGESKLSTREAIRSAANIAMMCVRQ